jgi:hypothetical protein
MARSLRDVLSQAGYSTQRADDPAVLREREQNPPREGHASHSASGLGPTCLIQDDHGPVVQKLTPAINNDIRTRGVIESTSEKKFRKVV